MVVCVFFGGVARAGAQVGQLEGEATTSQALPRHPIHMVPFHAPGTQPKKPGALNGTPTCATPQLSYFGGPVVSNAVVVPVFWSSAVNATTQANIGQFYADVTQSVLYDMLSEYQTNVAPVGGVGETRQSIGRGSATAGVVITPLKCAPGGTGCKLTDADIQAEIARQIGLATLPAPVMDSAGNTNTIYMVHFPPNVVVDDGSGSLSCSSGGFCAYHNTGLYQSKPLLYGVLMDTYTGACSAGCGNFSTGLGNQTATASHELAEAVTDSDIGLIAASATAVIYPGAWYDNNNNCGEIGDICDDGAVSTVTVLGRTWGVQDEWSNALKACVVTGLHDQFAVAAPAGATPGTGFNVTVTAKNPGGATTAQSFVGTVRFTSSDAAATLPADFSFVPGDVGTQLFSVTLKTPGTQTIKVTDSLNPTITGQASVVVSGGKQTPTITWATPAAITYGTLLSTTQLNATTPVPGTFAYAPVAGTLLTAGYQTLKTTFTPTDTTTYGIVTKSVVLTVRKATTKVTWATPSSIVWGKALSATQLNATASVPGTLVYTPVLGTVLNVGAQKLSVAFTPTDSANYANSTGAVTLNVVKATPVITWATPASIVYGTLLSGTQLDATASIGGTFAYSPAAGTLLGAGNKLLTTTFTPTDTAHYATKSASVSLAVKQAVPGLTWAAPAAIGYGTALSGTQLNATASVAGTLVYTPLAGTVLGAGNHTLAASFTPTDTVDYTKPKASVVLAVTRNAPAVTVTSWATTVKEGTSGLVTIQVSTAAGGVAPTGTVNLYWNGALAGTTTLNSSGVGTVTAIAPKVAGSLPLYASYAGNVNYLAEKSPTVVTTVGP